MKRKIYFSFMLFLTAVVGYSQGSEVYSTVQTYSGGYYGVYNTLTFNTGYIVTPRATPATSTAYFTAGSAYIGASDASHVNGYAEKEGTTAFTFPVGDGIKLRPAAISAPAASGRYQAAYWAQSGSAASLPTGAPFLITSKGPGVKTVSAVEYWDINGAAAVKVSLTWNAASAVATLTNSTLNSLIIVGWDGTKWVPISSAVDGTSILGGVSSLTAGSITSTTAIVPDTYTAYTLGAIANLDLTPTLPRPISTNFIINQTAEGVYRLSNLVANASTGTITVYLELGDGFELTVDPLATVSAGITVTNSQWDITDLGGGAFQFDSKPGTVISASGVVNLGYKVKATGTVTTTGILTATINPQTGGIIPEAGDFNANNNIAVKIFSIIP